MMRIVYGGNGWGCFTRIYHGFPVDLRFANSCCWIVPGTDLVTDSDSA
jgi:hypothetical protein